MDILTLVALALLLGSLLLLLAAFAVWFGAAMVSIIATLAVLIMGAGLAAMIGYVLRPSRKARG